MPPRKSKTFTEAELEFMQIIWDLGEVTTEDIQDALREQGREVTDGTIRKILANLVEKGYLSRYREGHSFYYKSNISKKQANKKMIHEFMKRAFQGSAMTMAASLFESQKFKKDELKQIKEMIKEYEKENPS